jgi:hypothetical protein
MIACVKTHTINLPGLDWLCKRTKKVLRWGQQEATEALLRMWLYATHPRHQPSSESPFLVQQEKYNQIQRRAETNQQLVR